MSSENSNIYAAVGDEDGQMWRVDVKSMRLIEATSGVDPGPVSYALQSPGTVHEQ